MPLVLRGELAVTSWAPSQLPETDDDTLARVRRLYEAADPGARRELERARSTRARSPATPDDARMGGRGGQAIAPLASAAARFLGSADGPRIAVLDAGGWDTHANQGAAQGPLAQRLRGLDDGPTAAEDGARRALAEHDGARRHGVRAHGRRQRHARHGSRHGRLRVPRSAAPSRAAACVADWPGLAARDLHEGRDLRATTDLRALFKAVLHERFGVSEGALARTVFPASDAVEPLEGVTAA